ncbi:MAG: NUDIX domain-containing protein, partial [Rubrivivax sp.]|nr:NUDIX domain-containing protein [Rubrivivax sp.]
ETGVWAGLWTLPDYPSVTALEALTEPWPGQGEWLPTVQHTLTHFDWTLHPLRWQWGPGAAPQPPVLPPGRWCTLDEALALGLPAPVRRLLAGG